MKRKTRNIITLIVILVLLIIMYVLAFLFRPSSQQARVESQPVIQNLKLDNVFVIDTNKDFQLKKVNEIWTVQKNGDAESIEVYQSNANQVQQFLSELAELQQGRLISSNPSDLASYNLEEDQSLNLSLSNEQEEIMLMLRLGVIEGANSATYMQFVPEQDVYQVDGIINNYLEADNLYWTDLRLYPESYSINAIDRYIISSYDEDETLSQSITLEKQDQEWKILGQDDLKIDTVLAEKYISDIFSLSGEDVSKNSIQNETRVVNVKGELSSGTVVLLDLYSFAGSYFAKTKGGQDTDTFMIGNEQAEMIINVSPEYFEAEAEEEVEDGERDPALEEDAFISEN